ncbi:MAG: ribosome small subunit-dependent GTPase A [Candidatus Latescibacterota bacterium]|nr:MAG: ribosome small subunit-dependent GTPase A [Candidatus Latescibacterota bacterium]
MTASWHASEASVDSLRDWGWSTHFEAAFAALDAAESEPARVVEAQRELFRVVTRAGERRARVAGRLRQEEHGPLPAVGDWVAVRVEADAVAIHQVLDRRSTISRKLPGKAAREQVLAANVDTVFVVTSFNEDFSPRRVERYLTMIWEAGARPVVLLNKADLTADPETMLAQAEAVALGVPVHAVCAERDAGLAALEPYLRPGATIVLLGSSGVGKSTIVNRLMGREVQTVQGIRDRDAKGRHTTHSRQLFRLPSGALTLDTPGLREVALWITETGLGQAFGDVEEIAEACRFHDCAHTSEPGCAVKAAVDEGRLARDRLESYHKLCRELEYLERKTDPAAASNEKRRWRSIQKNMRSARKKGWTRGES